MPPNGAPAYGDLIYTITDVGTEDVIEVEILGGANGTEVLGRKRFTGQTKHEVNIAPYIRRTFDRQPRWALTRSTTQPLGFIVIKGGIRIGTLSSELLDFVAGTKMMEPNRVQSDSPAGYVQAIARDECFEICVNNISHSVNYSHVSGNTGLLAYSVSTGAETRTYKCVERRPGAVRLCWLNPYGAMDYYTFYKTENQLFEAGKNLAYTTQGSIVCDSDVRTYTTVQSELEPHDVLAWLSQVISSPRVWVCESSEFRRVDIVTDNVKVSDKVPGRIEVTICERQTINF